MYHFRFAYDVHVGRKMIINICITNLYVYILMYLYTPERTLRVSYDNIHTDTTHIDMTNI